MVATTGAELLPPDAIAALRTRLLPQTKVLTPNLPEARLLLANAGYGHMAVDSVADLESVAKVVLSLGPAWVLVKGGHVPFRKDYSAAKTPDERQLVVDVLMSSEQTIRVETRYYHSRNTRKQSRASPPGSRHPTGSLQRVVPGGQLWQVSAAPG